MELPARFQRQRAARAFPEFDPATVLRDWGGGHGFRIGDALTGTAVFGATGSGKSSGPAQHLALAYLAEGFGVLVLTAKKEERALWEKYARLTGRLEDLLIFGVGSGLNFNFLQDEASRGGGGGGITANVVDMLMECIRAMGSGGAKTESGGDNQWFEDATRHMLMNLCDLAILAGIPITLKLMRSIVMSAARSVKEAQSSEWRDNSVCAAILREADARTQQAGPDVRADFEECQTYWMTELPALSEKTRSIIELSFSILVRSFITRPIAQLFGGAVSNITPDECFNGKIIVVDLPVQEYHLAGRLANLAWKYCFQRAVMRRSLPGKTGEFLRPAALWADEAQNFVTRFDAEYQAVARSAGGCTVYLTQSRESYRSVLGDDDAVDTLLANLQAKFFCQSSSTGTNAWAANLFGERWIEITTRTGGATGVGLGTSGGGVTANAGFSTAHQRRPYVEAAQFATLRRGGERNGFLVDCFVYNGGERYPSADGKEEVPYKFLTFNQRS